MKKTFILLALLSLLISCQREKANELGVSHNRELIIPPTSDLPNPNVENNSNIINNFEDNDSLLNSIITQTKADKVDNSVLDKIDDQSGYETDENFIKWLFKGKSKR